MTDIAGIDTTRLEISLQETYSRVLPGSTTEHPITLLNRTPLPDFFYLAVSGQAAAWATLDKESVNLFPNWSDNINLTVTLPDNLPNGTYPLEINASSRTQENVEANVTLTLLIGPEQPQQVIIPTAFDQQRNTGQFAPNGAVQDFHNAPVAAQPFNPAIPPYNPNAPFMPDYPRLQLDLSLGRIFVACGQTAEQVAHLLNLSATQQDFTIGLEGLPPQWLSFHPPSLHLSPNWSEAATIKIDVPLDAMPGRYLMGVKAVPVSHPEATSWAQFDLIIMPSAPAAPVNQPPASQQTGPFFPADAGNESAPTITSTHAPETITHSNGHSQPEILPAQSIQHVDVPAPMPAPHLETEQFHQPPAQPVNWQTGPFAPVQPAQASAPMPAPETTRESKKESKGGLFGWGKKKRGGKAEQDVQPPIMYAPMMPPPVVPETPAISQDHGASTVAPADEPTVINQVVPVVEPETSVVEQTVAPAKLTSPEASQTVVVDAVEPVEADETALPVESEATLVMPPRTETDSQTAEEYTQPDMGGHWLFNSFPSAPVVEDETPAAETEEPTATETSTVAPEETVAETPILEAAAVENLAVAPETTEVKSEPAASEPVLWTDQLSSQIDTLPAAPVTEPEPETTAVEQTAAPVVEVEDAARPAGEIEEPVQPVQQIEEAAQPAQEVLPIAPVAVEPAEEQTVALAPEAGAAKVSLQDRPTNKLWSAPLPAPAAQPETQTEEIQPVLEPVSLKNENFELSLETSRIEFELGESAEQKISLVNLMSDPAFFELHIEGLPAEWYSFSYSKINLFPNWKEEVYFRVEAPTTTTPGTFNGKLVTFTSLSPDERVEVELTVIVRPSERIADRIYHATGAGLPFKMPENARIELTLDTYNLSLAAGEKLEQQVSLTNHSPMPDYFELKLEGLLEDWFQFSTPSLNLFPNWSEQFYLMVNLPGNAVPGLYPVRLIVEGQAYPSLVAEANILLQVLPAPVVAQPAPEIAPVATPIVDTAEAAASVDEDDDEANRSSFSFASFFQQPDFRPAAPRPTPTPGTTPAAAPATASAAAPVQGQPDEEVELTARPADELIIPVYNQPTNAVPTYSQDTTQFNPYGQFQPPPYASTEIAPSQSLAGLIPVIATQEPVAAPPPPPIDYGPMPVAAPKKRTLWQKVTGQGKEQVQQTPKIDESAFWRAPVQPQPGQNAYDPMQQGGPAGNFQAGAAPIALSQTPAAPRSYAPIVAAAGEVARVQITLEKPHLTIVAGESAIQQVFLMNMTSLPDNFDLTIEGLPDNWFSFASTTVNLFPNWNEHTELTINISEKVKPDLYKGRIIAAATAQNGIRAVMPIEIEVLALLVVQARLQPHRGKGYKAHYELLLRNRSMSEGLMTMQWSPANEFSTGQFTPPQVILAPGQIQPVKLQVMLRKKTPSDQARQPQPFQVLVQPQWTVAQQPVITAPVAVQGEYSHRSRWVFIQRHPVLFTFLIIVALIAILWSFLILPFIQNTLLLVTLDKVTYSGVASKVLVADQQGFNQQLTTANPFNTFFPTSVKFIEGAKNTRGLVQIDMQAFVFTASMQGFLTVDSVKGTLIFTPTRTGETASFPWLFIPPEQVVNKLNGKVKDWLKTLNPPQRLDDVYIEGNTLFLTIRNCQIGEVACQ